MRRAGLVKTGTLLIFSATLLAGCMASPGPAPTVEEPLLADDPVSPNDASSPEDNDSAEDVAEDDATDDNQSDEDTAGRSVISVGIDPFQSGFNPHLVSDNTELVDALADLALPSAFNGNFLDEDVLKSAREIDAPRDVAQRVRYSINDAAQWSDGTPITGADFEYLWREMISTPGVREVAPYRAISRVSTSAGGRVVTVDFSDRVEDWYVLFAHLLPSHLLEPGEFDQVLDSDIPASAGKFSVVSIDQARGLITLNRNDRFWGKDPATVDVVELRAIRSTPQAASLLRSGQVSFVDIAPAQTLKEQLSLLDDVHTVDAFPARQLRLNLSTASQTLESASARRTLLSLIDSEQVARLATERSADIRVPYGGNPLLDTASSEEIAELRALSEDSPITIAVDPTDPVVSNAALTIVDTLEQSGIKSVVVEDRMTTIVEDLLPDGDVDAVISAVDSASTPANLASFFTCAAGTNSAAGTRGDNDKTGGSSDDSAESATSTAQATSSAAPTTSQERAQNEQQKWSGNLSLACFDDFEETARQLLSGEMGAQDGLALLREVNREHSLYLPLLDETRVRASNDEEDVDKDIADWQRGLTAAPEWEVTNDSQLSDE